MTDAKNFEQNSQYLWNILFSRRDVWVLLELVGRWTQNLTKIDQKLRHVKLDKFVFGSPWLPDLLCKHWFASSVWNFCHWVADVPPCETSPEAKSEEKRMFPQARHTSKSRAQLTNCTYYMSFLQSFEALLTVRHVLVSSQLQLKTCFLLPMGVCLKELQSNM